MTPRVRTRQRVLTLAAVAVLAVSTVAAAVALHRTRVTVQEEQAKPLAVGDCVVVTAPSPEAVQTRPASCAEDPSYTIGALTTVTGTCPTAEYQHFPAPAADRVTAGFCLVPNLIADHCYRLNMPVGVVERADCSTPSSGPDDGVLVQVTRRLDVHDQRACPSAGGHFAWPYPSPARTYCTATLF